MKRWILDYLLYKDGEGAYTDTNFPDLWPLITIAAGAFLILTIVLYNVQTRRLHRHFPLVNMQEWLLWTGLATFSLLLVEAIFKFYFLFVLLTLAAGIAAFIWIRFFRFPPLIEAYNEQLRRARFQSQQRVRQPESTIRRRTERTRRRRRT